MVVGKSAVDDEDDDDDDASCFLVPLLSTLPISSTMSSPSPFVVVVVKCGGSGFSSSDAGEIGTVMNVGGLRKIISFSTCGMAAGEIGAGVGSCCHTSSSFPFLSSSVSPVIDSGDVGGVSFIF